MCVQYTGQSWCVIARQGWAGQHAAWFKTGGCTATAIQEQPCVPWQLQYECLTLAYIQYAKTYFVAEAVCRALQWPNAEQYNACQPQAAYRCR